MKRFLGLICFIFLAASVSAINLDGRTVILLVSQHRSGDPAMEAVRAELLKARKDLGLGPEDIPIVYMGFEDSDTEREYFDRLGFQAFDSPVLCVAQWGNPARFGPKKVLDYGIARSATPEHVDFIVAEYLKAIGKPGKVVEPPPPRNDNPESGSGGLEILNVRFEAGGKKLFLTNAGVRLTNKNTLVLRDIKVRFYSKKTAEESWALMGTKLVEKILPNNSISSEIVGDTRKFGLVDQDGNPLKCLYRIEVEHQGDVIHQEGEYTPNQGATP